MVKEEKYTANCTDCGKEAQFLFKPDERRPVYCNPCGKKHKKEHFLKMLDYFEKTKQYGAAGIFCELEGEKSLAGKYYQKAEEIEQKGTKTLDSIVTSILAFGGLGLLFSFFSKPNVINAQNVQLAPPFPNYMIYVFATMLIGGAGYFLVRYIQKKRVSIPLSFQ